MTKPTIPLVLALFFASLAIAGAQGTATRVVLFNPFGVGSLRTGLAVSERVTGSCWIQSLSSQRADAWRCMAGNEIHDPCFSGSFKEEVACADGPFARSVVLIRLDKPLPSRAGSSPMGTPWGLELSNGMKCGFVTGGTFVVAGMRANYGCEHGGWIIGDPDRSTALWHVFYTANPKAADYTRVSVRTAIF